MSSEKLSKPEPTKNENVLGILSTPRKVALLAIICIAEFLDTFSNSALFSAIPPISKDLNISNADSVWLQSGYQLTFSALLLVSGRLSDVYSPKWVFIVGGMMLGLFSLGAGFVREEVPLLVLRALMGVGAALTVPSALHMIVHLFPDPKSQSNAVGFFGTAGSLGNVLGLIIGALFVSFATWPWVFYFMAILGILESLIVFFLCPPIDRSYESALDRAKRFEKLDLIGVTAFTASLILFTFALTSGSTVGWGTSRVIAPLVLSGVLIIFFFIYEAWIPESLAAVPPKMWRYTNFTVIVAIALLPYMWWGVVQSLFSWYWQVIFGWSPIITAVHFLPLGLIATPAVILATILQRSVSMKWVMIIGEILCIIGSVLLPFASSRPGYWRFAFPGLLIGSGGITITFVTANVAVFMTTPPETAGVVAAIFNSVLQLGVAAGIAIATSIQTSVEKSHGGPSSFSGRAAGLWFLFAVICLLSLVMLVFMKDTLPPMKKGPPPANESDSAERVEGSTESPVNP